MYDKSLKGDWEEQWDRRKLGECGASDKSEKKADSEIKVGKEMKFICTLLPPNFNMIHWTICGILYVIYVPESLWKKVENDETILFWSIITKHILKFMNI